MTSIYRPMTARTLKLSHGFCSLTTPDGYNPKTKKGRARGYSSLILHFAPGALSGFNVCRWASVGCLAGCLNTAGHGGIVKRGETTNEVQTARIARTRWFFADQAGFMAQLFGEIETHIRRARRNGLTPVVRLNGTSDIPWERVKNADGMTAFDAFPTIQFYDYSKSPARVLAHASGLLPSNYHLTFSRSESNASDVAMILRAGGNVAAVFSKSLPAEWNGSPVVNGDADDLRFLDPSGVVVGLKAKGRARRDRSGFVVQPDDAPQAPQPTVRAPFALPMVATA